MLISSICIVFLIFPAMTLKPSNRDNVMLMEKTADPKEYSGVMCYVASYVDRRVSTMKCKGTRCMNATFAVLPSRATPETGYTYLCGDVIRCDQQRFCSLIQELSVYPVIDCKVNCCTDDFCNKYPKVQLPDAAERPPKVVVKITIDDWKSNQNLHLIVLCLAAWMLIMVVLVVVRRRKAHLSSNGLKIETVKS